MKRFLVPAFELILSVCLLMVLATAAPKNPSTLGARTYKVMVGFEQPNSGISVMSYYPRVVKVHVGDTVQWEQNTNEIHTVTFLAGNPMPELLLPSAAVPGADPTVSPLVFNPTVVAAAIPPGGSYTGGTYANSGIMGREPGQVSEFSLSFDAEGTFDYVCVVHGVAMSGEVVVLASDQAIPSPNEATAEGWKEMAEALSLVPDVVRDAADQVLPPATNPDGSVTHNIEVGFSETVTASYGDTQIDLMQFFPDKVKVHQGDRVNFEMSATNMAPHTVTFLNGAEEPPLAVFDNGFLYLNSDVMLPSGGAVLTRNGSFNSGLLPPIPGTTYPLEVGAMRPGLQHYSCLLHDSSGMDGELMVVPLR